LKSSFAPQNIATQTNPFIKKKKKPAQPMRLSQEINLGVCSVMFANFCVQKVLFLKEVKNRN
jgi:hypothetical protein